MRDLEESANMWPRSQIAPRIRTVWQRRKLCLLVTFLIASLFIFFFIKNGMQESSIVTSSKQAKLRQTELTPSEDIPEAQSQISGIMKLALRLRLYKSLRSKGTTQAGGALLIHKLERMLFPWLKSHAIVEELLNKTTRPRGIVIATGQKDYKMAVHAIRVIRLLNCSLPVEVFYLGKDDLNPNSIAFLNSMPDVTAINIENVFDNTLLKLHGWDIKPFAILGSSFQEVVLMDADVVMVQSPEVMFNFTEYIEHGALFFADRLLRVTKRDYKSWFDKIIPRPHSETLRNSTLYNSTSDHEQESGVVVIDKRRRLLGLLATCLLNNGPERKEIHAWTYGDKETFWLGFEISKEPYSIYDKIHGPGIVGCLVRLANRSKSVLWGHLAHFTKQGELLWFNDGILFQKRDDPDKLGSFKFMSNVGSWVLNTLEPNVLVPLSLPLSTLIDQMKALWDKNPTLPETNSTVPNRDK